MCTWLVRISPLVRGVAEGPHYFSAARVWHPEVVWSPWSLSASVYWTSCAEAGCQFWHLGKSCCHWKCLLYDPQLLKSSKGKTKPYFTCYLDPLYINVTKEKITALIWTQSDAVFLGWEKFNWSETWIWMMTMIMGNWSKHGKCGSAPTWKSQWGASFGGQHPRPRIGSPVGNQALIVPRPLYDMLFAKTPSPWIEAANIYWVSLK